MPEEKVELVAPFLERERDDPSAPPCSWSLSSVSTLLKLTLLGRPSPQTPTPASRLKTQAIASVAPLSIALEMTWLVCIADRPKVLCKFVDARGTDETPSTPIPTPPADVDASPISSTSHGLAQLRRRLEPPPARLPLRLPPPPLSPTKSAIQ